MRNLWVYDSGAWVKPASVFVGRDGGWYQVDTLSIASDGEYKVVLDQFVINILTGLSLLYGNSDASPSEYTAYWQQMVGGRMFGDINNGGAVGITDVLLLLDYANRNFGSIPTVSRDYIEQVMIPFMTETPPPAI